MRTLKKYPILSVFIILIVFIYACTGGSSSNVKSKNTKREGITEIKFDTTFHDFGNLVQGEKASCIFTFENTGNSDLIIRDAYSTCGCTVPDYSKKPITPGEKGKVEVLFNSTGKKGVQYKTITLKLNTAKAKKTLTIKANVLESN